MVEKQKIFFIATKKIKKTINNYNNNTSIICNKKII